jgi:hypothetical protein
VVKVMKRQLLKEKELPIAQLQLEVMTISNSQREEIFFLLDG